MRAVWVSALARMTKSPWELWLISAGARCKVSPGTAISTKVGTSISTSTIQRERLRIAFRPALTKATPGISPGDHARLVTVPRILYSHAQRLSSPVAIPPNRD